MIQESTNPETRGLGSARRAFDRLTADSRDLYAHHVAHFSAEGQTRFSVSHLHALDGALEIEWCDDCPYLRVFCGHKFCSWDGTETVLTCDLCGEDLS